jgi:hypothetical protein
MFAGLAALVAAIAWIRHDASPSLAGYVRSLGVSETPAAEHFPHVGGSESNQRAKREDRSADRRNSRINTFRDLTVEMKMSNGLLNHTHKRSAEELHAPRRTIEHSGWRRHQPRRMSLFLSPWKCKD